MSPIDILTLSDAELKARLDKLPPLDWDDPAVKQRLAEIGEAMARVIRESGMTAEQVSAAIVRATGRFPKGDALLLQAELKRRKAKPLTVLRRLWRWATGR